MVGTVPTRAIPGAVGCEERVCFHISELWVFGLATLYFLDSSVESPFESLLAGLELGKWVEIELLSNQSRPAK